MRVALLLVAAVLGSLAIAASWVDRDALESDRWSDRSGELLERDDVRAGVADLVAGEVAAAGGDEAVARAATADVLADPGTARTWRELTVESHRGLAQALEGDARRDVSLDIGPIVDRATEALGFGASGESRPVLLVRAGQLRTTRTIVSAVRAAVWPLVLVTLALVAAAIAIAPPGRRRSTVAMAGAATALAGVLVVVAREALGATVASRLTSVGGASAAARATWDVFTAPLVGTAAIVAVVGVATLAAALLWPADGVAETARRR